MVVTFLYGLEFFEDNISFKKFDEQFLELSWNWLNDPEIKILTNAPDITREKQKEWFNSLPNRNDYIIWGVEADSVPIGVFGLKNITDMDCEYWGYIGDKRFWGKGLGKIILFSIENKARDLGMSYIWLKVIKKNTRALSLYTKQGYVVEREKDSLLIMRKQL